MGLFIYMAPIVIINKKRNPDYYLGKTAIKYEDKRKHQNSWKEEYKIVEKTISKYLPEKIIDIPVGTGRFFPIYEKYNVDVLGIDISPDMLKEAKKKNNNFALKQSSIFDEPLEGFVVCMRILNFFTKEEIFSILRKVKGYILFTLRHTTQEDIKELQEKTGLEIIENYYLKKSGKGDFYIYLAKK